MKISKITIFAAICVIALSTGLITAKAEDSSSSNKNNNATSGIRNRFEQNDVRNTMLDRKEDLKQKIASTTLLFKEIKNQNREKLSKMKAHLFEARRKALEKELTNSLNTIVKLRNQISNRITLVESKNDGKILRDMTSAKSTLVIADGKIEKAKTLVNTFVNTKFTTATSSASTTTDVNLDKPRKMGDEAIRALKDARDSLKDVTRAIAHAMGIGPAATSTATTTSY